MNRLAAVLALVGCLVTSSSSSAQSPPDEPGRAAARKLGYDGIEAYNAGDFAAASERLEQAYAILTVPSLGLWSARALSKQGRLVEASERYRTVSKLPLPDSGREVHEAAQREAVEELALLAPRIPTVTIRVEGRPVDSVVTLDGVVLADASIGTELPLNPGRHRIELTARGQSSERTFALQEGAKVRFELELPVAPTPGSAASPAARPAIAPRSPSAPADAPRSDEASGSSLRTAGLVSIGVGGAGVLFGTIVGGVAVGQNADLDEVCTDDVCPPSSRADVDAYGTMRVLSTVGFVVGAVGLATGVVLILIPSSTGGSAVEARMGPGTMAVSGSF